MHSCLGVTMVLLDDLVENWSEGGVGVMAASIDTDSRVGVQDTREDSCLDLEFSYCNSRTGGQHQQNG